MTRARQTRPVSRRPSTFHRYALFGVCLAILAGFLLWPIGLTVAGGFQDTRPDGLRTWTLRHVAAIFADPVLVRGLLNSFVIALLVTALSLGLALPLAMILARYDFAGKTLLSGLTLVPLILPPFVGAIGLRHLLGRYGAINSLLMQVGLVDAAHPIDFLGGARFAGVVLMEVLHLYPIAYLNLAAALANLDPALEQAAENLGASRWTRLRRIVLPLMMPGIFAGGTIVFIWSFTELGTPLMFDYYAVTPVQIFWGIQEMAASPRTFALVVVMLVSSLLLYALGKLALGGRAYATPTRGMTATAARRLGPLRGLLAASPFLAVTGLAILPHLGVVLTSFAEPGSWYQTALPARWTTQHYLSALGHPLASGSIRNSLFYAALATAVDLLLGLTIAYLIVRAKVRGAHLLDSLAMLPLAVPGLVLAFGYVAMTLRWPFPQLAEFFQLRGWEALASMCRVTGQAPNPMVFLVIAYAVRRLPYIVRSAVAGMEQVSEELEQAALNLGAKPLYAMRRVVLPLIAANLIAGGLLTFSFAMLEVSDSLILAQSEAHFPITKAIYTLFKRLGDGPYVAAAMGTWGMALMTTTLLGAATLLGKRLGAIFRM